MKARNRKTTRCPRCGSFSPDIDRHQWQARCRMVTLEATMTARGYVRAGTTTRLLKGTSLELIQWPSKPHADAPSGNNVRDFFWATWAPQWAVLLAAKRQLKLPSWKRKHLLVTVLKLPVDEREEITQALIAAHELGGTAQGFLLKLLSRLE